MTAVDTNIIVRILIGDDAGQTVAARAVFETGPIWISKTVLLETACVLGRLYEYESSAVHDALLIVLAFPDTTVEDEASVRLALSLMERGVTFADALHLFSCPPGAHFVSFDRTFIRRAKKAGVQDVSEVPA